MLERTRHRASALSYGAGFGLLRALPDAITRHGFQGFADYATVRNGPAAQQLRRNLRRVLGPDATENQLDAVVGAGMRSYARYWRETFVLESMDHADVIANFDRNETGIEHYREGLAAGKGVILALPHSGNWEASGIWLANDSGPFTTVAERLRPEWLFDRFVAYRESLGMEVLALTGGDRAPTAVLTERLRAGRVVCLVADRDLSRHGIDVDFFGERARMPAGPAMLAAMTGASLHAVRSYFTPDGWGHDISKPVLLPEGRLRDRVVDGTQQLADLFAGYIAERPEDWHMTSKLWLSDVEDEARDGAVSSGSDDGDPAMLPPAGRSARAARDGS